MLLQAAQLEITKDKATFDWVLDLPTVEAHVLDMPLLVP
jgi:hypothetical protein